MGAWTRSEAGADRLVFAESKKHKKERIGGTQLRLEAALKCGMRVEDFLVVEWSTTSHSESDTIFGL